MSQYFQDDTCFVFCKILLFQHQTHTRSHNDHERCYTEKPIPAAPMRRSITHETFVKKLSTMSEAAKLVCGSQVGSETIFFPS